MAAVAGDVGLFLSGAVPWARDTYVNIVAFQAEIDPQRDGKADLKFKAGRAAQNLEEARGFAGWCNDKGLEVYVVMSSQRHPGAGKAGRFGGTEYRSMRGLDNVAALRGFWIDVDVRPDPEHHPTVDAALAAIYAMCDAIALTHPTYVVETGGGLHVHWVLDGVIPVDVWRPLAGKLAEACRQHGVLADHSVTVDAARILRVPGTLNRKYGRPTVVPRPVRILVPSAQTPSTFVSLAVVSNALESYKPAENFQQSPTRYSGLLRGVPPLVSGFVVHQDPEGPIDPGHILAGIEESLPQPTIKEVAAGCPWIRDVLASGGKGEPQPRWFAAASVCVFTAGGFDDFRQLSKDYDGYDEKKAEELFYRQQNSQAESDRGWPRCTTIASMQTSQCATCPHLGERKSPLNFAVRQNPPAPEKQEPDPATPDAQPGVTRSGSDPQPPYKNVEVHGYQFNVDEGTYSYTKKDSEEPIKVTKMKIVNLDYKRDDDGKNYMFHFDTPLDAGGWVHVTVPMEKLGEQSLHAQLSPFGVGLASEEQRPFRRLMTDFRTLMQQHKRHIGRNEYMGWVGTPLNAFIYGTKRHNCVGTTYHHQTDAMLRSYYTPKGSFEPWKAAIKMINDEKRPAMDVLAATAFAAPLMRFTGQKGVIVMGYSPGSGYHKSSAILTSQATWGAHTAINQIGDTVNSVVKKVGVARVMPAFYDELKSSSDIAAFRDLTYRVASGRDKSRLKRSSDFMDISTWETMLVAAGNESLIASIGAHESTEAGINRVFEFQVSKPDPGRGQLSMGDASKVIALLQDNYGHAGEIYAAKLGASVYTLPDELQGDINELQRELQAPADERFWVAAAATILRGAIMANELNLARFDVGAMMDFIRDTFTYLRHHRSFATLNIEEASTLLTVLSRYINSSRGAMVVTDVISNATGRRGVQLPGVIIRNPQDIVKHMQLGLHYADTQGRLRISKAHLIKWLGHNNLAANEYANRLFTHFNGTEVYSRIGVGTSLDTSKEKLFEFNLTGHPALKDLFD